MHTSPQSNLQRCSAPAQRPQKIGGTCAMLVFACLPCRSKRTGTWMSSWNTGGWSHGLWRHGWRAGWVERWRWCDDVLRHHWYPQIPGTTTQYFHYHPPTNTGPENDHDQWRVVFQPPTIQRNHDMVYVGWGDGRHHQPSDLMSIRYPTCVCARCYGHCLPRCKRRLDVCGQNARLQVVLNY